MNIIRTRSVNERAKLKHLTPLALPTDELCYTADFAILYRDGVPHAVMLKASDQTSDASALEMSERIALDACVSKRGFQTWKEWTAWIARRDAFAQEMVA